MVTNNYPSEQQGLGNDPRQRQTEAFGNTKQRGEYFGMNDGKLIEPDQTPSLSAIEESYDENIEDEENFYADQEEIERVKSSKNPNSKKAELAIKQAALKEKSEGKSSEILNKLASKTWLATQKKLQVVEAIEEAKKILSKGGEKVSTDELLKEAEQPRPRAPFPTEMFITALIKDILDAPIESGIVTTIAGQIVSTVMGVVLFMWTFGKISGWFGYKKKLVRRILIFMAGTFVVEFIPFVRIAPANTVYVLLTHYEESKAVKLINLALDVMDRKNVVSILENLSKAKMLSNDEEKNK